MLAVTWKLIWDCLLKHVPTASLYSLGSLGHLRWLPRGSMLTASVPERRKWKLLAHFKAFLLAGRTLLLPYSVNQGHQRANLDLKRWRNKLYILVVIRGAWGMEICCSHLWKIPSTSAYDWKPWIFLFLPLFLSIYIFLLSSVMAFCYSSADTVKYGLYKHTLLAYVTQFLALTELD